MESQISLTDLCALIGGALRELDSSYWVTGEIAEMQVRRHAYLELIDKADEGAEITARVRATCWENTYRLLSAYFQQETGTTLQRGMQVLVRVKVSFHAVYGLSLNIEDIDPRFTLGDMARRRQQVIDRLQKEGVWDMQRMLSLPSFVRHIAIISSPDAAGYQDFCHQLENNAYGFHYKTRIFPATMQGETAEQSQVKALEQIYSTGEDFDVVVLIRGGGATTDLSCFDGYDIASSVAQFPIPVLTGIGHTKDVSIVDMVAFAALKTPTAVAEYILSLSVRQLERLEQLQQRLKRTAEKQLMLRQQKIERQHMRWQSLCERRIYREQQRLLLFKKQVEIHSPETIYRKGYSLTTIGGRIIKNTADVQAGETITTHLMDGQIESVIIKN